MSSSGNNDVPKKNKGRQKVKMARMEKDSNRQVTFSKRRCGLFKKASELCTLCGAEAAIIVFSPGKKAFSFGHPSVEAVLNRFLGAGALPNPPGNEQIEGARRDIDVHDLNMELTLMNSRIEAEKKRGEELSQMRKARAQQYWWDIPFLYLVLMKPKMQSVNLIKFAKALIGLNFTRVCGELTQTFWLQIG